MEPGQRARPPPETIPPEKREFRYPDFDGPQAVNRRCTDFLFLLLLILGWAIMTVVGLAAIGYISIPTIHKGDYDRLFHGVDYRGNICGIDDPVKDLKYKWEPNYNHITISSTGDFVPSALGVCVDSCPSQFSFAPDPYGTYGSWAPYISTSKVLGFCVPIDSSRAVAFAQNTVQDFAASGVIIAITGFILSAILSFLFLLSVRIPCVLRISVWLSITVVLLLMAGGAYFVLDEAKTQEGKDGSDAAPVIQVKLLKGLGYFLGAAALLWLCLIVYLRAKIALAISLIYETSKAVTAMPLLMFAPFFNVIIVAGFTVIWIVYCVYLATSGEVVDVSSDGYDYKDVRISEDAKKALLYMAFIWVWTASFVHGASQWICAHTVMSWYFRPKLSNVGSLQVIRSFGIFIRYHVGTVAFGSLILAVVQMLRAAFLYVKSKLKNKGSFPVKIALCCCSCCLCCLSKCVKYAGKQAYIHSALSGDSFCPAAKRAFGLIFRNLGRVATISVLSNLVLFVGKVSVAMSSAGIAYYYMTRFQKDKLNGVVVPALFVGIVAYICASLFLDTVTMTSDTILQAFLVDEEMKANDDGSARGASIRQHYADLELKTYMYRRQNSNPELFRWSTMDDERQLAVDPNYRYEEVGDHGAEIELREARHYPASRSVQPSAPRIAQI